MSFFPFISFLFSEEERTANKIIIIEEGHLRKLCITIIHTQYDRHPVFLISFLFFFKTRSALPKRCSCPTDDKKKKEVAVEQCVLIVVSRLSGR